MAGKPRNFQAISNVLPTYNFVDIASGTGFINFYAGDSGNAAAFHLSNYTFYSSNIVITSAGLADNLTDVVSLDYDYDVELNRPLNVAGITIVNIPFSSTSGTRHVTSAYVKAIFRKWDGATETDIATSSASAALSYSAAVQYKMGCVSLDIPLTHFKIGETMRLTIRVYATTDSGGAGASVSFAADPKNRTTGWDTSAAVPSQLVFQCPVRLNL